MDYGHNCRSLDVSTFFLFFFNICVGSRGPGEPINLTWYSSVMRATGNRNIVQEHRLRAAWNENDTRQAVSGAVVPFTFMQIVQYKFVGRSIN